MEPRSPGAFLEPDRGVLVWKNQINKIITRDCPTPERLGATNRSICPCDLSRRRLSIHLGVRIRPQILGKAL